MSTQFRKAVKFEKPLKLAILGAAGSGKTFTGLMLGAKIAELRGGRMAVIDTERGSASLYADLWDYDILELEPPFTSERFIESVDAAREADYQVLVCDSMTHYWAGAGGILDLVDKLARTKFQGNSYAAWSKGTPRHTAIIDSILGSKMDIIATMRTKTKYIEGENEHGRKAYIKAGVEPVQREGIDYEFDLVLRMNADHEAVIDKGRFPQLDGILLTPPDETLAEKLIEILKGEEGPDVPTIEEKVNEAATASDMAKELFLDPAIYNQFEDAAAVDRFVEYIMDKGGLVNEELGDPELNRLVYSAALLYGNTLADSGDKKGALAHTVKSFVAAVREMTADNAADDIPF